MVEKTKIVIIFIKIVLLSHRIVKLLTTFVALSIKTPLKQKIFVNLYKIIGNGTGISDKNEPKIIFA